MKTVICDIPMKENLVKLPYPCKEPALREDSAGMAWYYPANRVLAKTLEKNEQVHVLLMTSRGGDNKTEKNAEKFKEEFRTICEKKGINPGYEEIEMPFYLSRNVCAQVFRKIIGSIAQHSEILADITFGPKPLPMVVFSALNFAEKYLDAEIKNIVYGKVEFKGGEIIPGTDELFDITPLYYLNSMTHSINCDTAKTAMKIIDDFLVL